MARRLRHTPGGLVYHVLNRANARAEIFRGGRDYAAFEHVMAEALARLPLELFAYCLMPNHWHFVLRPAADGDLSQFMRWLTVTHTQRWHACRHTSGTGHLYQGRFKSFPVESNRHFLTVCRYVERNALRANLAPTAEAWRWSSLWRRCQDQQPPGPPISPWPVDEPCDWLAVVNRPQSPEEEDVLRRCTAKGRPYGSEQFVQWTTELLGLKSSLRDPGHPSTAEMAQ